MLHVGKIADLVGRAGRLSRAKSGAIWTVAGFGANNAIRLGSTLVLTRLLDPSAFGLMTLALTVLGALTMMSDLGTTQSVIRSRRAGDPDFLRTAWTIQALRGGAITVVACLAAWPIAALYEQPILLPLTCALAVSATLSGLRSISVTLKQREIELKTVTLMEVGVRAAGTGLTIAFAFALGSVWALAIGTVLGSLLGLLLSHLLFPPFRHRFRLERAAATEILTYGRWILVATLATFFGGQGILAVQGLLVPVDVLGLLAIATTIAVMLRELTARVMGNVAFPKFSELLRERPAEVAPALQKLRRLLVFGVTPVFVLLSGIAQDLVDLLFDDRYANAGWFLALLSLNAAIGVLAMPYQNLVLAAGDSRIHAGVMLLHAAFRISGIVVGFQLGGVTGMLVGDGCGQLATTLLSMAIAWRRGYATLGLDAAALTALLAVYGGQLALAGSV